MQIALCINFILSLVATFAFVFYSKRSGMVHQMMLSIVIAISNLGYFLLAISTTLEGAVFANTVSYAGGIFVPLIIMFLLAEFSKTKLPDWFAYFMCIMNIALYVVIATTERTGWYYATCDVVKPHGVPNIEITPGIFYPARFIMLAVEGALCIFFMILASNAKKKISAKTMLPYIFFLFFGFVAYAIEMVFNIKNTIVPFFYLVATWTLVFLCGRMSFYDVSFSVKEKIEEVSTYAYIVLDRRMNFIGCNKLTYKFFPEIEDAKIDRPLTPRNYALREVMSWVGSQSVKGEQHKGEKYRKQIVINDRNPEERKYLDVEMSYIHSPIRKLISGYLIEMTDVTAQHDQIEQLNFKEMRYRREAEHATERAKSMQMSIILGMAAMIESRDNSTGGHINRTSASVALFVGHLRELPDYNMSEHYWDCVINAAPLHDLGKIMVEDSILRKPSGLTDEEYDKMKTHAAAGAEIMSKVLVDVDDKEFVRIATNVAHYHHEKYDGTGYPDRLRGETIPFEARIMALSDVFDALASKRYYKAEMPYSEAFKVIEQSLGTQFDPHLGRIFLSLKDEIIELYDSFDATDYSRKAD